MRDTGEREITKKKYMIFPVISENLGAFKHQSLHDMQNRNKSITEKVNNPFLFRKLSILQFFLAALRVFDCNSYNRIFLTLCLVLQFMFTFHSLFSDL